MSAPSFERTVDLLLKARPFDIAELGTHIAVEAEIGERVVHDRIMHRPAGFRVGFVEKTRNGGFVGDVGLHRDDARSEPFGEHFRLRFAATIVDDNAGAFACEGFVIAAPVTSTFCSDRSIDFPGKRGKGRCIIQENGAYVPLATRRAICAAAPR